MTHPLTDYTITTQSWFPFRPIWRKKISHYLKTKWLLALSGHFSAKQNRALWRRIKNTHNFLLRAIWNIFICLIDACALSSDGQKNWFAIHLWQSDSRKDLVHSKGSTNVVTYINDASPSMIQMSIFVQTHLTRSKNMPCVSQERTTAITRRGSFLSCYQSCKSIKDRI